MTTKHLPLAFIVDDDAGIREFAEMVAIEAGYTVETAANGREFLRSLGNRQPAIVILDLNMSNSDGVQVMRELATRHFKSEIIILSGSDLKLLDSVSELAKKHGLTIAATVQKPVTKDELSAVLGRLKRAPQLFNAQALTECMTRKRLSLHYQPKIDLKTSKIIGVEALLRCTDMNDRRISPEVVVSVAEEAGIVDELTNWVFGEAAQQCRVWRKGGANFGLAVNLSPRNSFNPDLPQILAEICETNSLPTTDVTIELTEESAMDNELLAMETLVRLRLKGFCLSIDDFGTGYSSLSRLKQMPFTEIKVDKSFVVSLHASRDNAQIVKAIVQLAQNLEMRSVVEGVEDKAAVEFATSIGCDAAQGYYYSKPLPALEFQNLFLSK